ncbi:hypothetical protein ACO2Q0_02565 [Phenylobacterium sp. VNQ135]|uniref:hypothetical protein n=1 Tax=Phenylobacterium sp. VNQ135 TaxID=3400922 RepID=UPI003BFC95E3
MADLANLTETYCPDEIFDVELVGPDGATLFNDDGTPMTIGMIGEDSDEAVRHRNATTNKRIQQGARVKITAEALTSENMAYLAKLSKRWNITMGGEKPAFTSEAALKLYMNTKLSFIPERLAQAISERTNFLKSSPTS